MGKRIIDLDEIAYDADAVFEIDKASLVETRKITAGTIVGVATTAAATDATAKVNALAGTGRTTETVKGAYDKADANEEDINSIKTTGVNNNVIPLDQLTQAARDFIGSGGSVTNNPDDEDLETRAGAVIGLKDRLNISNQTGYRIIRSDFDFTSIPVNYANSIWEIRYEHNFSGATITLPANVTLRFNGGYFNNGTFTCDNTKIENSSEDKILSSSVTFTGIWDAINAAPEWFGAIGDGVADDTLAVQYAIEFLEDNVNNHTLNFINTYKITANTYIEKKLYLKGGYIKFVDVSFKPRGENIVFDGINIQSDQTSSILSAGLIRAEYNEVFYGPANNLVIKNCYIGNSTGNGVRIDNVTNVSIYNNEFNNLGNTSAVSGGGTLFNNVLHGNGIYLNRCEGADVINNKIINIRGDGGIINVGSKDVTIKNNFIKNTAYRGIRVREDGTTVENCLIEGNTISNCGELRIGTSGIGCNGIYYNVSLSDKNEVTVIGNTIKNVAENGIEGAGIIKNNLITKTGAYPTLSTSSQEGIFFLEGAQVECNTITNAAGKGIWCYTTNALNNTTVSKNTIINAVEEGIFIQVNTVPMNNLIVSENTIIGTSNANLSIYIDATSGGISTNSAVYKNSVTGYTGGRTLDGALDVSGNSWQDLVYTYTKDLPNVISGGYYSWVETLTGAVIGDLVTASCKSDIQGLILSCYISAIDTVTFQIFNATGADVNIGITDWYVLKHK